MAGFGLGARMQGRQVVTMTYIGDGGTSTGAFHEGLNFAAVQKLPLVLIAEDNKFAYSTPISATDGHRQHRSACGGVRDSPRDD